MALAICFVPSIALFVILLFTMATADERKTKIRTLEIDLDRSERRLSGRDAELTEVRAQLKEERASRVRSDLKLAQARNALTELAESDIGYAKFALKVIFDV